MTVPIEPNESLTLWDVAVVLSEIERHVAGGTQVSPMVLGRSLMKVRGTSIATSDLYAILTLWGWSKTETMDPAALSDEMVEAVLTLESDEGPKGVPAARDLCFLWKPSLKAEPSTLRPSDKRFLANIEHARLEFLAKLFAKEAFLVRKSSIQDLGGTLDSLCRGLGCAIRDEVNKSTRFAARDKLLMAGEVFTASISSVN
ncbi:MAG: hypothetical protein O9327_03405 [Polaromonas sp.]|nr:hypothetical protein [Polaromonas sp.]